ncbi:CRISPR-associated helicase Cas3' [Streptomyces sp. PRB2-1]|uniref:CRISPR-associated helicase Cas3 n=1 Tax=Actinacidiphila epipremni TaxID=2053013 RepID=A0ABX0ZIN7_9ACTN|nr:CRISPR-associated helicase Cas3' [Actinacidiphila epipremni]
MRLGADGDALRAAGVLWGKSAGRAGGRKNLLLQHLLDTAAVAGWMWDGFLAPATRALLDEVTGGEGRGRVLFVWLCGVHDVGKATPAFQRMWPEGAAAVRASGLGWQESVLAGCKRKWRHDRAGAYVLRRLLPEAGWTAEHVAWVWPLIAGHHGAFPSPGALAPPPQGLGQHAGGDAWERARKALLCRFTAEVTGGAGPGAVAPARVPSRAAQLHLSGLIVMADWIASDEEHFPGVDDIDAVSFDGARRRAAAAWKALRIRGGWTELAEPGPEDFGRRFGGQEPRDSQRMVMEAARRMPEPGLLVVEAPMGEGKTKAALMAAEILAARFGADGVFVGMPTQATSDPMFGQVRSWVAALDGELADHVALLHGKRMFNKEWRALVDGESEDGAGGRFEGVDEYGECWDDEWGGDLYGIAEPVTDRNPAARGPAEWFLGAKRGLLCPFVVGTIDQLLFAATRTKHVMLRMAGLAGKVVVLDEVHAADVYMSQFLAECLRWLGQARVPVVLLSATLPPAQRRELVEAYLAGAATQEEYTAQDFPEPAGYPSVIAASLPRTGAPARIDVATAAPWRRNAPAVTVELLPETLAGAKTPAEKREALRKSADLAVVTRLERELVDGGCALVIRNTVDRAQSLFTALRDRFGHDVVLLHARLAVGPRADRTADCLRMLGPQPDPTSPRPRTIVVATQLAEQSFDVDADLLVTDLAPTDLLLQRIGRLHRHDGVARPARLSVPRVLVTGFASDHEAARVGGPPAFLGGSTFIYGEHLLLRTAALVLRAAAEGGWQIPSDVPELVAQCYGDDLSTLPEPWRGPAESAAAEWQKEQRDRADRATPYLLTRRGDKEGPTLAGLHAGPGSGGRAPVRDGEMGLEAVLVYGGANGTAYRTLSRRALTVNGDVAEDMLDDVLAGTVRLPPPCTKDAVEELRPLPGWLAHPRLRYTPALVLDGNGCARVGRHLLSYDDELGLSVAAGA